MSLTRHSWGSLEVYTYGAADAYPLVLLHGFLGSPLDFSPMLESFAGHYYCVLPQLPGTGPHPGVLREFSERLTIESVVEELQSEVESRCGAQVYCAGYSMGGRIALAWSLAADSIIRKVAFISASPGIENDAARQARRADDAALAGMIADRGLEAFLDRWYRSPLFTGLVSSEAARAELVANRLRGNDPAWVAKILVELSPSEMHSYWDRLDTLPESRWLVGKEDQRYAEITAEIQRRYPLASVQLLQNASHALLSQRPHAVADELIAFFNGPRPTSRP